MNFVLKGLRDLLFFFQHLNILREFKLSFSFNAFSLFRYKQAYFNFVVETG